MCFKTVHALKILIYKEVKTIFKLINWFIDGVKPYYMTKEQYDLWFEDKKQSIL